MHSTRNENRTHKWLAWLILAGCVVLSSAAFLLSLGRTTSLPGVDPLQPVDVAYAIGLLSFPMVGALAVSRGRGGRVGWLLLGWGFAISLGLFVTDYTRFALLQHPGAWPLGKTAAWVSTWIGAPLLPGLIWILLLLPNGVADRRSKFIGTVTIVAAAASIVSTGLAPGSVGEIEVQNPLGWDAAGPTLELVGSLAGAILLGCLLAAVFGLVRKARSSDAAVREQIKWIAYSVTVALCLVLSLLLLQLAGTDMEAIGEFAIVICIMLVAAGFGASIVRHRLLGIEVALNRALVYGVLTTILAAAFAAGSALSAFLLEGRSDKGVLFVVTVAIALLVQPLRDRIQERVNRFMYGDARDPYSLLTALGKQLELTTDQDAVFVSMAETIRSAFRVPHAKILLFDGERLEVAAQAGEPTEGASTSFPLTHQGLPIGELVVAHRSGNDPLRASETNLLQDLARQAGVVAHAVRLNEELKASRAELINAREEERRRLRRDLHDGLGPTLAGITLEADAARDLVESDPQRSAEFLARIRGQASEAVEEIRRIVEALRPPSLDELGLIPAIEERSRALARGSGIDIDVSTPTKTVVLPAAVEVAAYRLVLEALNNMQRHSGARSCEVKISWNGSLRVEVSDDGRGFPESISFGVGLHSMRDRVAELGGSCSFETSSDGGARVVALIPVQER